MSTVAIPDTETENDRLNITRYVKGCADFILHCEAPMSIAVQGDWGTGKSSFMRMVEKEIKDTVTVIRFNTWQYSRVNDDRLFLPMLNVLTGKIDSAWHEKYPQDTEYDKYFKGEGKGAIHLPKAFSGIASLAGAAAGGGWVAFAAEMVKMLSAGETVQKEDYYKDVVEIRDKLQERVDIFTGAKYFQNGTPAVNPAGRQNRIVIFVDDLDRLRPASAVALLEDMKNFMDCRGCVFMLALDHKLVESGVKAKYGEDLDDAYARKFFEKIVQIPFYLPVNRYDIRSYVEDLLQNGGLSAVLDTDECTETVKVFTDGNPRVIKRALNAFRMNLYMNPESTPEEHRRMFAVLLLQSVDEDLFREITRILETDSSLKTYFEKTVMVIPGEWTEKHPDAEKKWAYLGELYDHDLFLLREDIFRSMVLETSRFREAGDERDKVFDLICGYLQEKGMTPTVTEGSRTAETFIKEQAEIEVVKYENAAHANVNFRSLTGRKADELIADLEKTGAYIRKDEGREIRLYFDEQDESSYIGKGKYIYIRRAVYDRKVFLVIGEIVGRMFAQQTEIRADFTSCQT